MMYLHFETLEQAEIVLTNAGFELSEYKDSFYPIRRIVRAEGWGTIFKIPISVTISEDGETADEVFEDGIFVNVYDCEHIAELAPYEVPTPLTPYNVIA